ncbi:winged helix-turn-helix domain-containing protein [Actinoplanes sp. NPDC051633]|uniref:winged helix-turn-helix domain-containing protein n=1 Tax=Actinoplanes sp. NPDC051633 TaxID=3155670 RepID=UPI00343F572B
MTSSIGYLAVGIASSADDRRALAQLLGDTEAFLIVSSVEQARQFLSRVGGADADLVERLPAELTTQEGNEPVVVAPARAVAAQAAEARIMVTETVEMAEQPGSPETPVDPALRVDSDRRMLRWLDREVGLTRLEHDFLACLLGAPGRIWTYQRLHHEVWGNELLGRGSDLHSVVRRLRAKLARIGAAATIQAVRGVGFRLAAH